MGTVIVLFGPKGVGKSWVAETIERELGVHYLDADKLILDLMAAGDAPDPVNGWLRWVKTATLSELAVHEMVSVEATGAFESDFIFLEHLGAEGHRLVRVWLDAPEDTCLERLRTRTSLKVPIGESEARAIYLAATQRASTEEWDLTLDMSGSQDSPVVVAAIQSIIG